MLLPSGNLFKCNEDVLSLQPTMTWMAINISVQYNGGFLPDIILLIQCYYTIGEPV